MTEIIVSGGAMDDGPAIQAALSGAVTVRLPDPVYNIATKFSLNAQGQRVIGDGRGAVKLRCSTAAAAIGVDAGVSEFEISNFDMERVGAALSGQNAIETGAGYVEQGLIERLRIRDFWHGMRLGPTSYSKVDDVLIQNSYDNGWVMTNRYVPTGGALQWDTYRILSETSNGLGGLIEAVTGDASLGDHFQMKTWANGLGGVALRRTGDFKLHGFRSTDPFHGQDGGHELAIDSGAGAGHQIASPYIELAGRSACGRGLAFPMPNAGCGIYAKPGVGRLTIVGGQVEGCAWSGIETWAIKGNISGGTMAASNGAANFPGERCGIYLGGSTVMTGATVFDHYVSVFVQIDEQMIKGNDLRGWSAAPISAAVPLSYSITTPNLT